MREVVVGSWYRDAVGSGRVGNGTKRFKSETDQIIFYLTKPFDLKRHKMKRYRTKRHRNKIVRSKTVHNYSKRYETVWWKFINRYETVW